MSDRTREAAATWRELLGARTLANGGYVVTTDRGRERVYTIMATERDLDELAGLIEVAASLPASVREAGERVRVLRP